VGGACRCASVALALEQVRPCAQDAACVMRNLTVDNVRPSVSAPGRAVEERLQVVAHGPRKGANREGPGQSPEGQHPTRSKT